MSNPDNAVVDEVFADPAVNQEVRDVLQMLSSLKYVPDEELNSAPTHASAAPPAPDQQAPSAPGEALSRSFPESTPGEAAIGTVEDFLQRDVPSDGLMETEPFGGRVDSEEDAAEPQRDTHDAAEPDSGLPLREQSNRDAADGGMVILVAGPIPDAALGEEISEMASLLDVPVTMDTEYGRFQAFEVSTIRDDTAPSSGDAALRRPVKGAAGAMFFASSIYVMHLLRPDRDRNAEPRLRKAPGARALPRSETA
jgi:hypothetical protein